MTRKRIGYGKLGRSLTLNNNPGFQGNMEATNLLFRLAERNPDVDWIIIGKRTKYTTELPPNVIDPWDPKDVWDTQRVIDLAPTLDGNVIHLGQHGTSHRSIPFINKTWAETTEGEHGRTKPLETQLNYGQHIMKILQQCGDQTDGKAPVSWICTDPRNFMKGRDLKWPTGLDRILAQGEQKRFGYHERFLDLRAPESLGFNAEQHRGGEVWKFQQHYRYGGLELMIIPDDWETYSDQTPFWEERASFGITTTAAYVPPRQLRRSALVHDYVLNNIPDAPIYGAWDKQSLDEIKPMSVVENDPNDFHRILSSFKSTIALPAPARQSGDIYWTTSKPMQCFMLGTVCFFLGDLDRDGWLIPNTKLGVDGHRVGDGLYSIRQDWSADELHLAKWLRITSPEDLKKKVAAVESSRDTYEWIASTQWRLLQRRWEEHYTERIIEHQLGITHD